MTALRNGLLYGLGLAALAGTSLRHRIGGYRKPSDLSSSDRAGAVRHVLAIVQDWQRHLARPEGTPRSLSGLDVLELGPGANLGTGILLAGLGVRSYRAVDAFALAEHAPTDFYRALCEADLPAGFDRDRMRAAVAAMEQGTPEPIAYVVEPDFDILRAAEGRHFDLIVSNAAFEHFDDVARVLAQVSAVARPGARFVAGVDFQTHTRGVRSLDPNSIYRFSPGLYRRLSFPGQPNRLRPADYLDALRRLGWRDTACRPVDVAGADYLAWSVAGLDPAFRRDDAAMAILTGIVVAEKA